MAIHKMSTTPQWKVRKEEKARMEAAALTALAQHRERSREVHRQEVLRRATEGHRDLRAPRDSLELEVARLTAPGEQKRNRRAFLRLLLLVDTRAPRLLEIRDDQNARSYVAALLRVAGLYQHWLRPPEEWRPPCRRPARQFADLVRHLLATYPVSPVMDRVFFAAEDRVQPGWFRHVAQGGNLRTAPELPTPLTKKMAHRVMEAPEELTFLQALRWRQVRGVEGSPRLARTIALSDLGEGFFPTLLEEWWESVFRWLADQPMLDPVQVAPMLHYLDHRKRQDRTFSMKGRSANAVLELTTEWTRARDRCRQSRVFVPSGIAPEEWLHETAPGGPVWGVSEILSLRGLGAEGRSMGHCVFTYADSIRRRRSSIWSVHRWGSTGVVRALTLEVYNGSRKLVQARGRFNRDPEPEERLILVEWCRAHGLRIELEH